MADDPAQELPDRDEAGRFTEGNSMAFRKGPDWKGNPGGRPKGSSIVAPLRRLLAEDENAHGEGRLAVAHAQRLLDIALGKAGDDPKKVAAELKALALTLERVDGKVAQSFTAGEDQELKITLEARPVAKKPE